MNDSSKQIVTVFGGAGYIGSVLVRQLLEDGHKVRVFDNMLFGSDGLRQVHDQVEIIEADICDIKAVSEATIGSHAVILLSAIIGHRFVDVARKTTRDINLLASSVVVDAAIEHGVERFIFASTDGVYGKQSGIVYETTVPEPVSLHSRLKLRMEERVLAAKRKHFHPTVLRIGSAFGYSPRMRFDLVANELTRDAVFSNEISPESIDEYRSFIHVIDTAKAFTSCLDAHVNMVSGEIFNVAHPEQSCTIKQLADIIHKLKPELKLSYGSQNPELADYHLSGSKIMKTLDFIPQYSLEEGIGDLMNILSQGAIENPYSLRYYNS